MKFDSLGLSEPILRAIAAEGYTAPTPIQFKAIPQVLKGGDLLGCAQTGTGKTAAFAWPILQRLSEAHSPQQSKPATPGGGGRAKLRALILAPTRELASQIADSFRAYGRHLHLRHAVIFGGVNQHHQVKALRAGVDILIATPGRLLDLMNQGHVDLRSIEIFVLDEADRMLDMGFIHDIRRTVAALPQKRQTLMFSATMPPDIRKLADSILHHPASVAVNPVGSAVQSIAQSVFFVQRENKAALLTQLLKANGMARTLVFTRTKHGADKVVKHLDRAGINAAAIHGNKSQNNRMRVLSQFKSKNPPVLVATDIASRGIDVDDITHVINYDLPDVPETYVHRIGRTARAGANGVAISFCDHEQRDDLRAIERLIRTPIEVNSMHMIPAPQHRDANVQNSHSNRHAHADRNGARNANNYNGRAAAHDGAAAGASHRDRAHRSGHSHEHRNVSSSRVKKSEAPFKNRSGRPQHSAKKHTPRRDGQSEFVSRHASADKPKPRSFQQRGRGRARRGNG